MEALRQQIQRYLRNHTEIEEAFQLLIEHEVIDMVLSREITQAEGQELLEMVA